MMRRFAFALYVAACLLPLALPGRSPALAPAAVQLNCTAPGVIVEGFPLCPDNARREVRSA